MILHDTSTCIGCKVPFAVNANLIHRPHILVHVVIFPHDIVDISIAVAQCHVCHALAVGQVEEEHVPVGSLDVLSEEGVREVISRGLLLGSLWLLGSRKISGRKLYKEVINSVFDYQQHAVVMLHT